MMIGGRLNHVSVAMERTRSARLLTEAALARNIETEPHSGNTADATVALSRALHELRQAEALLCSEVAQMKAEGK